jgi:hypothetical protein
MDDSRLQLLEQLVVVDVLGALTLIQAVDIVFL